MNSTNRPIIISLLLLCIFNVNVKAQQALGNTKEELIKMPIPPSPNAAALGKFGEIPVGLSTGIPSISLPFYQYADPVKKLNLSVGLSYHAGGNRVEDMASNVGLGWALDAGGVVSRTVRGLPDENINGFWTSATLPEHNTNFEFTGSVDVQTLNANEGITYYNNTTSFYKIRDILDRHLDGEADIFTFNAGSLTGKFFIDKTGAVHLFTKANIDIIKISNYSLIDGFKIIDRNTGVSYYFEIQEASYISNPNGLGFDDMSYTSSWYLSKIVSADLMDMITFTYSSPGSLSYESGESKFYQVRYNGFNKTSESVTTNWNVTTINAIRVSTITFPDQTLLEFSYDFSRADFGGDKALTLVKISNKNFQKQFVLSYDYFINDCPGGNCLDQYSLNDGSKRLKLTQVQQSDSSKTLPPYIFQYNQTRLPGRRSALKDSWGYYNGGGGNEYPPLYSSTQQELSFLAGRPTMAMFAQSEAVEQFAKACMLEQINYPTGGYTRFTYNINDCFSDNYRVTYQRADVTFTEAEVNINKELTMNNRSNEDSVSVQVFITPISAPPPPGDPQVPQSTITLSITSTDNIVSFSRSFEYDFSLKTLNETFQLPVGKTYQVAFSRDFYNNETYNISVSYIYGILPRNRAVGGLRVSKVEDFDGDLNSGGSSQPPVATNYTYVREDGKSSGQLQFIPNYDLYKTLLRQWSSPGTDQVSWYEINYNQSSQPTQTLGSFMGSPVMYSRVRVDKGSGDLSNGYSIHEFSNLENTLVNSAGYPFIQSQEKEWRQGMPVKEYYYDKDGSLLRFIENEYNYYDDNISGDSVRQLIAGEVFSDSYNTPTEKIYAARSYYMWSGRSELKKTTEEVYHGTNKLVNITEYEYDANKFLITKKRQNLSDGSWKEVRLYYPHNYTQTTLPLAVAQDNGEGEVVSEESWLQKGTDSLITQALVNDYDTYNGHVLKSSVWKTELAQPLTSTQFGTFNPTVLRRHNSIKEQVQILKYDSLGRIQEVKTKNGITNSFIWGEYKSQPIAQVVNASSNEIFYTSFEDGSDGVTDLNAPTGSKSHSGDYTTSFVLPSGTEKSYQVSYWTFNGTQWQFKEESYTGPGKVLTGNRIDEVRIYPANGQITTYSYKPLVGMTSATDPNGRTTYYEYDDFGRLSYIRDKDNNILKKICYNYQGQTESCPLGTGNFAKSGTFTKNNCVNGTGSSVTYTVPANTYFGPNADALAQSDVNNNGQAYANANGTCTPNSPNSTIYARIEVVNFDESSGDDYFSDGSHTAYHYKGGDMWVKFYTDAACTTPLTLTSPITVNWSISGFMDQPNYYNSGTYPQTTDIPAGVNGYELYSSAGMGGQTYWYDSDGNLIDYEYYRDYWSLTSNGTVYIIVQPNQIPDNW